MSIVHELIITDRIRVAKSKEIGDGSTQSNVIEAVVCHAICTDTESGLTKSYNPWVELDLSELSSSDFVSLSSLTELPQRSKAQLESWHESQKEGLEAQLLSLASQPKEIQAPWSIVDPLPENGA